MWSTFFLCFLVGLAAATSGGDYAWKQGSEYEYQVRGRTLAALHQVDNQYTGIMIRAQLTIRPAGDGVLYGRLKDMQYAQVHAKLTGGWNSDIPEGQLSFRPMQLANKPFEIHMKNGTVQELVVDQSTPNWEANIIKSVISQIQVDVQGENMIKSRYNQPDESNSKSESISAEFKNMEDTVTGKCETLYDINELPEYILQSRPELAPLPHLRGDGQIIDVVKTRNYSNCDERIIYHYGLGKIEGWEPASASMGDVFLKSSVSRVILSGTLKRHTIQSSVTVNKIVLKPTPGAEQSGMVVSTLNITLARVGASSGSQEQVSQRQSLGNLVYRYDNPYSTHNQARQGSRNSYEHQYDSSSSSSNEEHEQQRRHPRSLSRRSNYDSSSSSSSSSSSEESNEQWQQDKPSMAQPPATPLLPYAIGFQGRSIKNAQNINIVQAVQKLAKEIGSELQQPSDIPKQDTLGKFTILCRLLRTMNFQEMQEASRDLYNLKNKQDRKDTDCWRAYRDAVAQAGTGPALLIVKDWIQNQKIRGAEAAAVIATVAASARTPTDEYMRTYFTLATDNKVQQQALLNDTAILSFAELVRKVYINKEVSRNEYPVYVFGKFYKQGQEQVYDEYIPYLAKQMKQAIEEADSHRIQVYIRALGNIGHRHILREFEPYLEGEKQISQFQRLLMVVCLDQLVKVSPKTARSVLYKIYQNEGETPEIRVAAVHQLMRCNPPASMLQRMAQATHFDSSNDVSSAVKSAVESAATLQHPAHIELASNAQAAVPLLNPKIYGMQYSKQYLRDYVMDQMQQEEQRQQHGIKQHITLLGCDDCIISQGVFYSLRGNSGRAWRQFMNLEAMVSNVEDLIQVVNDQTEDDEIENILGAKQYSKQQFASEQIRRLLKIQYEEREQLEGNVHFGLAGVRRFYTFNNQTIEQLPQLYQQLYQQLKQGREFNLTKLYNPFEMTLSFPTAMGLPFVYTLDTPTLLSIHGEARAIVHPEPKGKNEIQVPETVNITADIRAVLSTKTQAKLGFVTPFDHQHYVAGYDKKIQLNLPLRTKLDIDVENQQVRFEVEPLDQDGQKENILHYSSWPYTAKHDILDLKPVSRVSNTEIVHIRKPQGCEFEFGHKAGMVFRVQGQTEHKFFDLKMLQEQYQRSSASPFAFIMSPLTRDSLVYTNLNLQYDDKQSHADSVSFQLGWNTTQFNGKRQGQSPEFNQLFAKIHDLEDSDDRQEYFLEKAASDINSASAYVYDMSVQFQGKEQHQYNATLAVATSPVDSKSRVLFYYQKDASNEKDNELCFLSENKVPNTNGLDFNYALKFDPTTRSQMKLAFGEKCQGQSSQIELKAKLEKTEERKQYLQSQPMAQQCFEQMKKGNQQLYACRNMTVRANFLDQYTVDIKYQNIDHEARNLTHRVYNMFRHLGYPYMDENMLEGHGQRNQIQIQANWDPDFQSVNVSVETQETQTAFNNIRMNQWDRALFAIHPAFGVSERLSGEAHQELFQPTCVVDQNQVNTFDNRTYSMDLGKTWHVQMHYYARGVRQQQDEQGQGRRSRFQSEDDYDYVVLVRDSGNNQKDLKLILNDEKNYFEVDMMPSSSSGSNSGSNLAARVILNQQQIQFDDQQSYDIGNGLMHVYALPNGEVKLDVNGDFFIIYDGQRVKLSTVQSNQFRSQVRGLCGNFDGEKATDFLTPNNCIVREAQDFVATYAIIDSSAQGPAKERQARAQQAKCFEREQTYANVISRRDYEQSGNDNDYNSQRQHSSGSSSCSKQQTQYIEEDGGETLCFSVRPVPVCRDGCKADKKVVKNVDVHCVKRSNASELWQRQIQKGASPDFSHKPTTKTIKMKIPQTCSP